MRNTSGKSLAGLLVLAVLALVVFLVTLLSKKKESSPTANLPRPQRNNNPFALIQQVPSKWVGLVGTDPGTPAGFLTFDSPVNGVRAGFINLYNKYYSQGRRTIFAIVPVYLGTDDTDELRAYANGLISFSGYQMKQELTWPQFYDLGRAIERFENGYRWVADADFTKGYTLASQYTDAR